MNIQPFPNRGATVLGNSGPRGYGAPGSSPMATRFPPIPGAYVLGVDLARPLALSLPGKAPVTLGPGRYFYAGGAHGPGGIKARGSRHMRKRKALRWHIGHLAEAGTVAGILALPQGRECAALAALRSQPGTPVPVKGFGSSDRRACPAHLVMAAPGHGHPD